jgi:hypothetical protein
VEFIGELERAFAAAIYPNRGPVAIASLAAVVVIALVARRRSWASVVRRNPGRSGAALLLAVALTVSVGWYLASPLFLSTTVDEPAPIVETAAGPVALPSRAPSSRQATTVPSLAPIPTLVPLVALSGSFKGMDEFHFGRGTARLIETAPGQFVIRLENFEVRNGPDLYVYLSPKADGYAKGSVEVGRLKADKGSQNYALPPGTDISSAASVVIWCKQFSVLFATATLGDS